MVEKGQNGNDDPAVQQKESDRQENDSKNGDLSIKMDHEAYVNPVFINDVVVGENGKNKSRHPDESVVVTPPGVNETTADGQLPGTNGVSEDENVSKQDSHLEEREKYDQDDGSRDNVVSRALTFVEKSVAAFYRKHRTIIKSAFTFALFALYNIYLGFAIHLKWTVTKTWCEGVKFLVLITVVAYFFIVYYVLLKRYLLRPTIKAMSAQTGFLTKVLKHRRFSTCVWIVLGVAVLAFLIYDSKDNRSRLISAGGLFIIIALGYIFSAHPRKIIWRHVLWGLLLQFLLGLVVLRWQVGQDFFDCLGSKTKAFLDFTDQGSGFVFGYLVTGKLQGLPDQQTIFAFKVLSTVIFFSFVISILYYYGVMQILVMKVGWFLQATVGTTACESTNAAANIFLGMTEAPLMIKPYLASMTKSELHAVMTGGFATVAGSVLAAYINFGVNPSHLLSASVMSAPAALGYAKLFYPETEVSKTKSEDIVVEKGVERNAIEAAANGASSAVALVANIAANLIAFLAGVHFLNSNLSWFGSLVGWDFLTFEWILSEVFRPLAFIMGVPWVECKQVGKLIGLKTIVNEFVAYQELAVMQKHGELSPRSEAISVFALCGFSNIGSIGIMLGALTTLAPTRKSDMAKVAVRAMIAGSAACFTTACIAGTLLDESIRQIAPSAPMQILPLT